MPNKQINDLWFKAPDHDRIIGKRHDFHDIELVQEQDLRNLNMTGFIDEDSDPYKRED